MGIFWKMNPLNSGAFFKQFASLAVLFGTVLLVEIVPVCVPGVRWEDESMVGGLNCFLLGKAL